MNSFSSKEQKSMEVVLTEIQNLVRKKGYIYALLMLLFEDFQIDVETIHEIDLRSRLNVKEAALLVGFYIKFPLNFDIPSSPEELLQMKKDTRKLLDELHQSFNLPFFEKLQKSLSTKTEVENIDTDKKMFFGNGEMIVEPIFYSGTGVYDFQYLDFLEPKYRYDKDWLLKNRQFDIENTKKITYRIKEILQSKSQKVNIVHLNERLDEVKEKFKETNPDEDWDKYCADTLPVIEFYQYVALFFENIKGDEFKLENIREEGWKSFYKGLIDLFTIKRSDFDKNFEMNSYLKNFSIDPAQDTNLQFNKVGDYNIVDSHPLLKIDDERYLVLNSFLLFQAVYESPHYWMFDDLPYRDQLSISRGKTGEEITYKFLYAIFGAERTFKSVKIKDRNGDDITDIDVLCILGSKALCVQVKSKKLSILARTGNDGQLQKDFKGAVQDAFQQGLESRREILDRNTNFFDEKGNKINLSEGIDEVYIMGITTENYPSLTHQSHILLEKNKQDPYPLFLTIFDLELLVYYLNDPYEFLYYIRQRTNLMEYFMADEEMAFLGFHLREKLWKIPSVDRYLIDPSFAQLIDRNYYPFKAGITVSSENDRIKNKWFNEGFQTLCENLKAIGKDKITDIIFHLLDWSGDARSSLVDFIKKTKSETLKDGKTHNFSMPPDYTYTPKVGVTYLSLSSDNGEELKQRLLFLCPIRKYKSKGDVWIGFGSLKSSSAMIDLVVFNDTAWEYDEDLENRAKILDGSGKGTEMRIGKKLGRNDKCHCGSGIKYKKCCEDNDKTTK